MGFWEKLYLSPVSLVIELLETSGKKKILNHCVLSINILVTAMSNFDISANFLDF